MVTGTSMPTGAPINCPAPVAELLESVRSRPLPAAGGGVPGGIANVTRGEGVVRGVGYAVGFKNVGFSEGFDDLLDRARAALDGRR